MSVGTLKAQLLTLHDVRLHKEGDVLVGQARITQQELSAALPTYLDLRPMSASENGIVAQVSASVLGHRVATRIAVLADSGRVVVRPEGLPFGSLATITVFGDPRVYVQRLGAELRGQNYMLTARARCDSARAHAALQGFRVSGSLGRRVKGVAACHAPLTAGGQLLN